MTSSLVGKVIHDRYRVDAFVASGGMGEVYKAWDLYRNVYLALKVLRAELNEDPSAFKRFQREAEALLKLAHPNIVPFYGLDEVNGRYFLLQKFINGESLSDILRRRQGRPLPVGEALIYLKSLCASLGYAHSMGIVHCDVKPSNVMIEDGGSIYLTDFGISRYAESISTTVGSIGTPAYMAPEQVRGEKLSPAADIYALGVMLFEMVTGQRPFRGTESGLNASGTPGERIRKAQVMLPPPDPQDINPSISPALGQVILHALEKDPHQRYPSTLAFLGAAAGALRMQPADIPDRVYTDQLLETAVELPVDEPPLHLPPFQAAETSEVQREPAGRARLLLAPLLVLGGLGAAALLVMVALWGVRQLGQRALAQEDTAVPSAAVEVMPGGEVSPTPPAVQATSTTGGQEAFPTPTETTGPPAAATATQSLVPSGSSWTSPVDGMLLVQVPAGVFLMGADDSPWAFERPQHPVALDAFWIDRTEVTNAMFEVFATDSGYQTDAERVGSGLVYTTTFNQVEGADWRHPHGPQSSLAGRAQYPVVQVSWNDARAYCEWAGRRLPSEAEWEKAARGTEGAEYPWGSGLNCSLANYQGCNGDAVPVGSYLAGASPYGALDMAGNVWEWVADYYDAGYYSISPAENPTGPETGSERVHRGGGWYDIPEHVRPAYRYGNAPTRTFNSVGFRCAYGD